MLGESKQTFFTVKDLSAQEFIESFAQYLKKNNLIERPAWVDLVKLSTSTSIFYLGN
jgi:ribosomal protein S19E (S16A)